MYNQIEMIEQTDTNEAFAHKVSRFIIRSLENLTMCVGILFGAWLLWDTYAMATIQQLDVWLVAAHPLIDYVKAELGSSDVSNAKFGIAVGSIAIFLCMLRHTPSVTHTMTTREQAEQQAKLHAWSEQNPWRWM